MLEETAPSAPETPALQVLDVGSDQLTHDREIQSSCVRRILQAEEAGRLLGQESPVYECHKFVATEEGRTYAEAITRQLNHLSELLGVLGFQVSYRNDRKASDVSGPEEGYFEVRVFALAPQEQV